MTSPICKEFWCFEEFFQITITFYCYFQSRCIILILFMEKPEKWKIVFNYFFYIFMKRIKWRIKILQFLSLLEGHQKISIPIFSCLVHIGIVHFKHFLFCIWEYSIFIIFSPVFYLYIIFFLGIHFILLAKVLVYLIQEGAIGADITSRRFIFFIWPNKILFLPFTMIHSFCTRIHSSLFLPSFHLKKFILARSVSNHPSSLLVITLPSQNA